MTSGISDRREQIVRYYGFYTDVFRGLRQKNQEPWLPFFLKKILSGPHVLGEQRI